MSTRIVLCHLLLIVTLAGSNLLGLLPRGLAAGFVSEAHAASVSPFLDSKDFTFVAWVYWEGGAPWQRIFDFGQDTSRYMFLTPARGNNTLRFAITTGGWSAEQQLNHTSPLATNQWVHVAVTLAGDSGQLYLNGESVDSQTITLNPNQVAGSQNWLAKSQYPDDPYFNGRLDEVAVFDRALSQSEIQGVMASGWDSLPGQTLGLHMEESPATDGTLIADSSGQWNDGRLVTADGDDKSESGPGHVGQALSFDGEDDYLVLPATLHVSPFLDSEDFTFVAWVYWEGGGGWQRIFDFGQDTSRYMNLTPASGNNTLRFAITTGGWPAEQQLNHTSPLATNQWVHVAVTLACDSGQLYLNGESVDSQTITLNPNQVVGSQRWLGRSQYDHDLYFNGRLDEVAVFDRALSQTEIQAVMASGWDPLPGQTLGLHMEENPATDWTLIADSSGHGNHGWLVMADETEPWISKSGVGKLGQALSFDGYNDHLVLPTLSEKDALEYAKKFAPVLKFDYEAETFPMDAQKYYEERLCGDYGGPFAPFSSYVGWDDVEYYRTIQTADIDGDGKAELLGRSSFGMDSYDFDVVNKKWVQLGDPYPFSDGDGWNQKKFYSTIQTADIDGDGKAELLGRSSFGMVSYYFDVVNKKWVQLGDAGPFSDGDGWNQEKFYSTIQTADIDGDGKAELLGRSSFGMVSYYFDVVNKKWVQLGDAGPFPSTGWDDVEYYSTIQTADIDEDGKAELLGRSEDGMVSYITSGWWQLGDPYPFSDGDGWNQEKFYSTIQTADINGDGKAELLGRSRFGMDSYQFNVGTNAWDRLVPDDGLPFSDGDGWVEKKFYSTIQTADINGDGKAELLGRSRFGMDSYQFNVGTNAWDRLVPDDGLPFSDRDGWDQEKFYSTIQTADINGDGKAELLGRSASGMLAFEFNVGTNAWDPTTCAPSYIANWTTGSMTELEQGKPTYSTLPGGRMPTYYAVNECGTTGQLRIQYRWFYGWQPNCDACTDVIDQRHIADWEQIVVTTSEDRQEIAAVTYYQHSGRYTKIHGEGNPNFPTENGHPVVYVGKTAHGSYHNSGGSGTVLYYEDYRRPHAPQDWWETYDSPLINLKGNEQSWLVDIRNRGWYWGYWEGELKLYGIGGVVPGDDKCDLKMCKEDGCLWSDCKIGSRTEPWDCVWGDGEWAPKSKIAIPTEDDGLTLQPRLSLNKIGLVCQVQAGQLLTYTLTYANHGNQQAENVVLTETYDPRTLYHTASPPPAVDNNVWPIGTLLPDGSGTISVTVRVKEDVPGDATLRNKAMLSGDDLSTEVAIVYTAVYPALGCHTYLPVILK